MKCLFQETKIIVNNEHMISDGHMAIVRATLKMAIHSQRLHSKLPEVASVAICIF